MTMLRTTILTGLVGLSLALGACDKGDAGTKDTKKTAATKDTKAKDAKAGPDAENDAEKDEPLDDRVTKAADLANKIEADPAKADDILAEAGMDRAAFDALLHEISTPELAEQYRLARARTAG